MRTLKLRYKSTCVECGADLPAGTLANYDALTKEVLCATHVAAADGVEDEVEPAATPVQPSWDLLPAVRAGRCHLCDVPYAKGALVAAGNEQVCCVSCGGYDDVVDAGVAGGSARTMHNDKREQRASAVRARHKVLGGLILAVAPDDVNGAKWGKGAVGEERLGPGLELAAAAVGGHVLHDRAIPGSTANLDHVVIVPAGVFVIDAKRWAGIVELRDVGGMFRRDVRLYVGGRDRTSAVTASVKQAERVSKALTAADSTAHLVCSAAVCFVDAEWPLLSKNDHSLHGVRVGPPKAIYKAVRDAGQLDAATCRHVAQVLAAAFPPKKR